MQMECAPGGARSPRSPGFPRMGQPGWPSPSSSDTFDGRFRRPLTQPARLPVPRLLLSALAALALCSDVSSKPPMQAAALALTDVTVIDGTGVAPVRGMTVLVQGSRIAGVFEAGSRAI